jgi:hypothetical protein
MTDRAVVPSCVLLDRLRADFSPLFPSGPHLVRTDSPAHLALQYHLDEDI